MDYIIHLAIIISIYSILATSLNLLVGNTGLLSVTHAAFFGIGAYTLAILTKNLGMGFTESMMIGAVITGLFAYFISKLLSRLNNDYYALGSFGVNIIVVAIFMNWDSLTGGPMGIFGIAKPTIGGYTIQDNLVYLAFSVFVAIVTILICRYVSYSNVGRVLTAIRDDETAVSSFGYKVANYKNFVFVLTASIAAIAGALYASYISFIDPSSFSLNESMTILSIILLGGLASIRGSIAGTVLIILLPELLRFVGLPDSVAAQLRVAIYGLGLILITYYKSSGLFGKYAP